LTIFPVCEDLRADSAIFRALMPSSPVINGFSFSSTASAKWRSSSFNGSTIVCRGWSVSSMFSILSSCVM